MASSSVLTSGGTEVRSCGMTSPSFRAGPSPLRGSSATYCSPTADWLCTSASRSEGILMSEFSDSTAATPVIGQVDTLHRADLGAAVGDVAPRIQPARFRQLHGHAVLADAEHSAGSRM